MQFAQRSSTSTSSSPRDSQRSGWRNSDPQLGQVDDATTATLRSGPDGTLTAYRDRHRHLLVVGADEAVPARHRELAGVRVVARRRVRVEALDALRPLAQ